MSRNDCILEIDSPSYPPSGDEFLQCGCAACEKELANHIERIVADEPTSVRSGRELMKQ